MNKQDYFKNADTRYKCSIISETGVEREVDEEDMGKSIHDTLPIDILQVGEILIVYGDTKQRNKAYGLARVRKNRFDYDVKCINRDNMLMIKRIS